ncbi:hypothetical protein ACLB2K_055185 [Fragaria x ananassa]
MSSFNIPEEIVIDILLRLPSKSLVRFTCVCKSWQDLIRSSSFARSHLNRNTARRSHRYLYAYHRSTTDHEPAKHYQHSLFSIETFEPCLNLRHPLWTGKQFRIYGSCNGLLCISDKNLRSNSPICIWNPSIQKFRVLPNIGTPLRLKSTYRLIWNPIRKSCIRKSHARLSFGFDPQLNDYMVVRIVESELSNLVEVVEVYTLSTNSWKRIRVTPPWSNSIYIHMGSAFLNGIEYWTAKTCSGYKIAAFDTRSKQFQELMVPKEDSIWLLLVRVCQESLRFFHYYEGSIDLWMMKEQCLNKVGKAHLPEKGGYPVPLISSSMDNELVIMHQYRDEHGLEFDQMAIFNIESRQSIRTGIRLERKDFGYFDGGSYIESLVLLSD